MKRYLLLFTASFVFTLCARGQNLSGLYGECDNGFGKYACQQVLLDTNGRFEYYDYLHLNGKKINKGEWTQSGDTVILNSDNKPRIVYEKDSSRDITISVIDTSGYSHFGRVFINADTIAVGLDDSNRVTIPGREIYKLTVAIFPNTYVLNFTPAELDSVSKITIYVQVDFTATTIFKDEKWLVSNNTLLHTRLRTGEFDKERGFKRTALRNKKF